MKLRLRSLDTKETQKIEVPNSCSINQLKQILSQSIPSSSLSSLRLSLNRKDEIQASSSEDSLKSLGITSGDLIFYTVDINPFMSSSQTLSPSSSVQVAAPKIESVTTPTVSAEADMSDADLCLDDSEDRKNRNFTIQNEEPSFGAEIADMIDVQDGSIQFRVKRNSEPCFMKRVLDEEIGNDLDDQMKLVVGVLAVIMDSGFVLCDGISGLQVGRNHLPKAWPSSAPVLSLWYTLPEISSNDSFTVKYTVVLKFMNLGNVVMIYGSLSDSESVHKVNLEKVKFARAVGSMLAIDKGEIRDEREFFNFWKIVKDGLALPLLIDICDKAGLEYPPCFMRLPTDLKVKILESLTGLDIAKVACVCLEMQYLCSNNDLWRQKIKEEFGDWHVAKDVSYWKELFAGHWDAKKKAEKARPTTLGVTVRVPVPFPMIGNRRPFPMIGDPNPLGIRMGDPNPFGSPDNFPGCGLLPPFRQVQAGFPQLQQRRKFSPPCNLGGYDS